MYKRILAAIDWTASTEAVLEQTRHLASLTGATVIVLHVRATDFPSLPSILGTLASQALAGEPAASDANTVARRMVDDAVAVLSTAGVHAEGLLLESTPGYTPRAVLDQARELDVDLIVLGSRQHSRPSALFRSNVADEVCRHTKCPVLIVP
ncbi:universal stress protein [Actinoallomurus purpureus]|uniref:universal stress protein n=1 Tax=Actinoallomurus purpureus TaxID=478114 RepID=UPI002093CF17|nr:universal stress protein [Actinoallomurus purpureus]MCO6008434.1 universal stress protein [Actinoallomurus purpureus]